MPLFHFESNIGKLNRRCASQLSDTVDDRNSPHSSKNKSGENMTEKRLISYRKQLEEPIVMENSGTMKDDKDEVPASNLINADDETVQMLSK